MNLTGKIFVLFTTLLLVSTTAMTQPNGNSKSADSTFESVAKQYIEDLLQANPEWATQLGDHRFDHRLNDYSLASVEKNRRFNRDYLKRLDAISTDKLSQVNRVDHRILRENLESNLFGLDVLREYEWNPLTYNPGSAINNLISRDFAPLKERLTSIKGRLEAIPAVVAAAKANLKNPPRIHTETAIGQNKGVISLVRDELPMFINQVPEMKGEMAAAQTKAVAALEDYGKFLETELLPRSTGEFRLGDQKYRQKLRYTLESGLTKEQILATAEKDLRATQNQMYETALPLYKQYFPSETDQAKFADKKTVIKAVLARLAEQRPTNETIVAKANDSLKATTEFVRANNLVTVPDEPVKIIVMPEFQRGVAVAYCDSAGPFEKNNTTFYAISPTPKDWTPTRAESFFREYNDFMVEDLTVHEAMPGHYLQLIHANKFQAPTKLRAIFGSGTFVEGWAVYSEELMAERGYGGAPVKMQQLKMLLRVIINSIIDQKVHTAGMTEKDAIAFMMNEGFQEEGEAAGKWRRACLTSTQLSTYYVGSVEVKDIRRAYEAKNPGKIDFKQMHDQMLSFGSPAPKYVKEMMGL